MNSVARLAMLSKCSVRYMFGIIRHCSREKFCSLSQSVVPVGSVLCSLPEIFLLTLTFVRIIIQFKFFCSLIYIHNISILNFG